MTWIITDKNTPLAPLKGVIKKSVEIHVIRVIRVLLFDCTDRKIFMRSVPS
jgi:hypothetical protein